ncbi:MAG: TetR/AcrR family transcriptional regulator, partial [Terricaulis sp.]
FQAAARIEFLEKGFEAACVNNVVRAAGGSLATLYAQFNNKEGLFLAVAEEQHEQLVAAMTPPCVAHLSLEDGLQVIGERFLTALISRENLAFYRIVIGEGRKFPQLLQRYVFAGADRIRNVVAAHLERTARDIEDADMVASYFLEAVRSRHHYRALADDGYTLREEELSEHVSRSVRFFLAGARAL